jgi:hypothetical protein
MAREQRHHGEVAAPKGCAGLPNITIDPHWCCPSQRQLQTSIDSGQLFLHSPLQYPWSAALTSESDMEISKTKFNGGYCAMIFVDCNY